MHTWVIQRWWTWSFHPGAIWLGMLLDRGSGCTSSGWVWSPGATKSGISFCFLLLDHFDYSLAVLWLSLTFVTDLSLPIFFTGPALVTSGQPSAWGGSVPRDCGPPEGGVGSSWVWSGRLVWVLVGCTVPFIYIDGPTSYQEASMNPTATMSKPPSQELEHVDP